MNRRYFIRFLFLAAFGLTSWATNIQAQESPGESPKAKYVFLFIGDGMGHAHVTMTEAYTAALQDRIGLEKLSFSAFPHVGQSTTYANNRLITCSAAAGTALATGSKTNINRISMDPEGEKSFPTIAEKAKKAGYRIGIVTSVSIDHATPAVFYAHQPDRDMYFEIGIDLVNSGFDYFAGGGFLIPQGKYQGADVILTDLAVEKGYKLVNTAEGFNALNPSAGKALVLSPRTAEGASLPYALDMTPQDITLADYTAKGIMMLKGEDGFFMMVEGGKIDWLGHSNDAAATVHEVKAFDDAVKQALTFYQKYPEETLIIVTADHETGGLSLGHRDMRYEFNLELLKYQKSSIEELNRIVQQFRVSKSGDPDADFTRMLKALETDLGLASVKNGTELTESETETLKQLFRESITDIPNEKSTYNEYEPFMARAMEYMNRKAGVNWGTGSHTAVNVPVYAIGAGAEKFSGLTDNTDIPKIIEQLMGLR